MGNTPFERKFDGLFIDYCTNNISKGSFYLHTHNEYELLYIISGDVTHGIEDRKYKLKRDDLVIVRPYECHFIQNDSDMPYQRYNLLFDANKLGITNIDMLPKGLDVISCQGNPIIKDIFKKMDYYQSVMDGDEFKDIVSLLLKELIYNLSFSATQKSESLNTNPIITKALEEINFSLFTIKNISEIANKLFITESYLYRIFKRELKTTPLKYITEKRLLVAGDLIAQGKSPTHIFNLCGFEDYTAFYRNYVKFFGYLPSKTKKEKSSIN